MFEEKNDTLLAKWLAEELTPKELTEFEKNDAFLEYQAIANASARFLKPVYNKERLYDKIKIKRTEKKQSKVITLKTVMPSLALVACLVLIAGFFFNTITHETGIGEQLAVVLPDGSKVDLNANSTLQHKRFFWDSNRNVNLEGEAFFEVKIGNKFKVNTNLGTVTVLGTKFNIRARENSLKLTCYKGKVQFKDSKQNNTILTSGQSVLVINGRLEKQETTKDKPSWLSGISVFNNVTLNTVLEELKVQYNITIKSSKVDLKQRFSGNFLHNNLEMALQTVLVPMNINYTLDNSVLELKTE